MKRRSVLKRLAGIGLMSLSAVNLPVYAAGRQSMQARRRMGGTFETDELGRLYLSAFPEERAACQQLRKEVVSDNDTSLSHTFAETIRNDFRNDNTVNLHGWILSRTELRLSTINIL